MKNFKQSLSKIWRLSTAIFLSFQMFYIPSLAAGNDYPFAPPPPDNLYSFPYSLEPGYARTVVGNYQLDPVLLRSVMFLIQDVYDTSGIKIDLNAHDSGSNKTMVETDEYAQKCHDQTAVPNMSITILYNANKNILKLMDTKNQLRSEVDGNIDEAKIIVGSELTPLFNDSDIQRIENILASEDIPIPTDRVYEAVKEIVKIIYTDKSLKPTERLSSIINDGYFKEAPIEMNIDWQAKIEADIDNFFSAETDPFVRIKLMSMNKAVSTAPGSSEAPSYPLTHTYLLTGSQKNTDELISLLNEKSIDTPYADRIFLVHNTDTDTGGIILGKNVSNMLNDSDISDIMASINAPKTFSNPSKFLHTSSLFYTRIADRNNIEYTPILSEAKDMLKENNANYLYVIIAFFLLLVVCTSVFIVKKKKK